MDWNFTHRRFERGRIGAESPPSSEERKKDDDDSGDASGGDQESKPEGKEKFDAFVGKTVADLLDAQNLSLFECRFIDEPPGVLRDLFIPATKWRVSLKREPYMFSAPGKWSADAVRQVRIDGIRSANR